MAFVLAVCVVATLAGARTYAEIARRVLDLPQSLLKKLGSRWNWFTVCHQRPSLSVIWDVLTKIDGDELDRITGVWLFRQASKSSDGEWELAIDGKVMRGAWSDENNRVTLFSAMIHREAITIAQVIVPDDTDEQPALVTVDAAHTHHDAAEAIHAKPKFDYLMNVRGNRPTLHRAVFETILPLLRDAPHDVMHEKSRGRIKAWSCWITSAEGIDFPHAS